MKVISHGGGASMVLKSTQSLWISPRDLDSAPISVDVTLRGRDCVLSIWYLSGR